MSSIYSATRVRGINSRDFDAALEALDPDVHWHQIMEFPDRGVYRGRNEVRDRFWNHQLIDQFGDPGSMLRSSSTPVITSR